MKFWDLAQLGQLGQHLAGRRVGGVGAVGVEDGGHDAVAVVDGLDPGGGVLVAGGFDVDDLVRGVGLAEIGEQPGAERAPGGGEDGDWSGRFRGGGHVNQAFRSKRWKR